MRATFKLVAAVGAAALLAACGSATNAPSSGSSTPKSTSSTAPRPRQVPRLHGDRHRRHRRPVLQRLVVAGHAGSGGGRLEHLGQVPAVAVEQRLHAEHQRLHPAEVRDHRHRRVPDGRQHPDGGQGQPEPEVRDRRLQLLARSSRNVDSLVFNTVQDGFLGGYLAAAQVQDPQGGHLRRPEAADRDHLHGRLLGRRAVLQPAEPRQRQGPRLEREDPERQLHRRLHQPDARARR